LFAYLRTMTAPTSLFAAPGGLERPGAEHPDRPGRGRARVADGERLRGQDQGRVLAELSARVRSAGGTETATDLDTDMMRLATGGSAR